MPEIYLAGAAVYRGTAAAPLKERKAHLKNAYGYDARRLSRLTINALAAALQLKTPLPSDTAVITASTFSSPALFDAMLANALNPDSVAKPFDFLANLHNAPAFHTAEAHGLAGASLHIMLPPDGSGWEWPLFKAASDIQYGYESAVLVIYTEEAAAGMPESASSFEGAAAYLLQADAGCGQQVSLLQSPQPDDMPYPADDGIALSPHDCWQCVSSCCSPAAAAVHFADALPAGAVLCSRRRLLRIAPAVG